MGSKLSFGCLSDHKRPPARLAGHGQGLRHRVHPGVIDLCSRSRAELLRLSFDDDNPAELRDRLSHYHLLDAATRFEMCDEPDAQHLLLAFSSPVPLTLFQLPLAPIAAVSPDAPIAAVDERDGNGTPHDTPSLRRGSAAAHCESPDTVQSPTAVLTAPTSFEGLREQRQTLPPLAHGHHLTDAASGATRVTPVNAPDKVVVSETDSYNEIVCGTNRIRSTLTPATDSQGFGHKQRQLHWDHQLAEKTDGKTEVEQREHWADTVSLFLILPDVLLSFCQMLSSISFTGTASADLAPSQVCFSSRHSYRTSNGMRIGPLD